MTERFKNDAECRVFISTDAGSTGLNLQSASLIINLDLPWNPAVLEQRIGRIYRYGQKNGVQVINLVSKGTIEERMIDKLRFKQNMFSGVLDGGEDTIFAGEDRFKQIINALDDLTEEKETDIATTTTAEAIDSAETSAQHKSKSDAEEVTQHSQISSSKPAHDDYFDEESPLEGYLFEDEDDYDNDEFYYGYEDDYFDDEQYDDEDISDGYYDCISDNMAEHKPTHSDAATSGAGSNDSANADSTVPRGSDATVEPQQLVAQGISFISGLAQTLQSPQATKQLVDSLVKTDAEGHTSLNIPVPNKETVEQMLNVFSKLFQSIK